MCEYIQKLTNYLSHCESIKEANAFCFLRENKVFLLCDGSITGKVTSP